MKLPKRFLVVDDDRSNNLICEFSLRRFSASTEIKTFLKPEVALEYIKEYYQAEQNDTCTVIFLDINMPVLSGWDFLDLFNEFDSLIKKQFEVYMLTSSIDVRDREKADLNPLVKGFLCKPLSTDVINKIFTKD